MRCLFGVYVAFAMVVTPRDSTTDVPVGEVLAIVPSLLSETMVPFGVPAIHRIISVVWLGVKRSNAEPGSFGPDLRHLVLAGAMIC